jgi:hypothetical protein
MSDPSWSKLSYYNPSKMLVELDALFDSSGIKKYKNASDILLKRAVRDIAEDRRCAIFCHGAGQALGRQILFAPHESSDYDYVGAFQHDGAIAKFPIQLKQLVPGRLNPSTDLQAEIDKLKKYSGTSDLVVAIHINRKIHLKPQNLEVSDLKIKELWLFGQLGLGNQDWLLFGNLMGNNPNAYTFQLPAA